MTSSFCTPLTVPAALQAGKIQFPFWLDWINTGDRSGVTVGPRSEIIVTFMDLRPASYSGQVAAATAAATAAVISATAAGLTAEIRPDVCLPHGLVCV